MNVPDPRTLKHRPVLLLPYAEHDGDYEAADTDCRYISLGWAQYDPRQLSVKTMRHTGNRWSRQSEELPLHRCIDAAILVAMAVAKPDGAKNVELPAGTLERQNRLHRLSIETQGDFDRAEVERRLGDPMLVRRLGKLADVLVSLRSTERI